jgi:hypothetical protein
MGLPRTPEIERALSVASEELGLKDYYRDCVRPLLGAAPEGWPRCCGGQCEPCAELLCAVARRVHDLLSSDGSPTGEGVG